MEYLVFSLLKMFKIIKCLVEYQLSIRYNNIRINHSLKSGYFYFDFTSIFYFLVFIPLYLDAFTGLYPMTELYSEAESNSNWLFFCYSGIN